ncbi:MAG: 50S ribosomal protein L35 [Balneolaceae bacterium]|nr:50S ribosomal protein L35 [Balneolaceae bacterium]
MPKMKSNSGAKKRFKVTGSGKIKRKKAYKSHILTKKRSKRKRQLGKDTTVDKTDEKSIKQMLPYKS